MIGSAIGKGFNGAGEAIVTITGLWDYRTNTGAVEQTGSGEFIWDAAYRYIRLAQFLYGDVDGDGEINSADVTLLRRYVAAENKAAFPEANPSFCEIRAKVAGGDTITALDVTLLRRWIAADKDKKPLLGPQPSEPALP